MESLVNYEELSLLLRRVNAITNLSFSIVNHCNANCIFVFKRMEKIRNFTWI